MTAQVQYDCLMKRVSPLLLILLIFLGVAAGFCLAWMGLSDTARFTAAVTAIVLCPFVLFEVVPLAVFDILLPRAMSSLAKQLRERASGSMAVTIAMMVAMIVFLTAWMALMAFLIGG